MNLLHKFLHFYQVGFFIFIQQLQQQLVVYKYLDHRSSIYYLVHTRLLPLLINHSFLFSRQRICISPLLSITMLNLQLKYKNFKFHLRVTRLVLRKNSLVLIPILLIQIYYFRFQHQKDFQSHNIILDPKL